MPSVKLPTKIEAADLADISAYSVRHLRDLAKAGTIPVAARGVYPFSAVKQLFAYLHLKLTERVDLASLEAQKLAKQIEVLDEDISSKKRKNREESNTLVEVQAVNAAQLSVDNIVRQKILELGNRFESRYVEGMPVAKFRLMIDQLTDEILSELSKQIDLFAQSSTEEEESEE